MDELLVRNSFSTGLINVEGPYLILVATAKKSRW